LAEQLEPSRCNTHKVTCSMMKTAAEISGGPRHAPPLGPAGRKIEPTSTGAKIIRAKVGLLEGTSKNEPLTKLQ
jgi:hypothetical protein